MGRIVAVRGGRGRVWRCAAVDTGWALRPRAVTVTPQSRERGSIERMTVTPEGHHGDPEEVLARLDDLTDRVEHLEETASTGPRLPTGVSSLGAAEGDYEDEGKPAP
jgi:hypothetical protein